MGKNKLFTLIYTILLILSVTPVPMSHQNTLRINNSFSYQNTSAISLSNLTAEFSTFCGGKDTDHGYSIAATPDGCFYITGYTESTDFPIRNAFDNSLSGTMDALVSKFTEDGSLLWSTYLGGSGRDRAFAIATANDGSCYVMGMTNSSDFPIKNAYNSTFSGNEDIFLTRISAEGILLWSTYLGGTDRETASDIAVFSDGSCFITGETYSTNFPMKNAYDSSFNGILDAFVAKVSSNGTLLWSSFLGGKYGDGGQSLAVSREGSCYVTGITVSDDFPTLNAFNATSNGDMDGFIARFDTTGSLLWSTYLGGMAWDEANGIAVSNKGCCYVTGYTGSLDFPIINAFNNTYGNWGDAYVTKIDCDGSLLWSTYLGGNGIDRAHAIATADDGSCYVTGETSSSNFPISNSYDDSYNGVYDSFVTKFSQGGSYLWGTYLGGSRTDYGKGISVSGKGICYIVGTTHSIDFPNTNNAFDHSLGGTTDVFITKFTDPLYNSELSEIYYGFFVFITFGLLVVLVLYIKRK